MDSTELISRCKAGDSHALHLLYQQYKPRLLAICRQYAKEEDAAEDLLHDAFVVILTSLNQLRNTDKLGAWMTSIVRNVGYHYREHLGKEQMALEQMAKESETTAETILSLDYNQIQTLVSQLPKGYQQVFRLSVFEGLSHQEISNLLGIAPHTSSSQLFHAKRMLQMLIKQLWVLILLLIAIPTVIWKYLHKQEPQQQQPVASKCKPRLQPTSPVEKNNEKPVYTSIGKKPLSPSIYYRTEAVILPDSIPYQMAEEQTETTIETAQTPEMEITKDTTITHQLIPNTQLAIKSAAADCSWNINLTYNGLIGRSDDYLADASIGRGSFNAASNMQIPTEQMFSNWIDYNNYLNYSPFVTDDAETRSIMNIAAQNSVNNGGWMEARYEHQRPITLQILLNRQLSKRFSIETGLSYTQLNSTITTGSTQAFIQEKQHLRYLGLPIRLGWLWYSKAHLSLYSSAGTMLELPIHSTVDVNHISNGINTFQKESPLKVKNQWSTSLGFGLQYNFTPHLGLYLEPNLQYFFDDGSDLKSYRTEHPLQITLPLGIRFHW